MTPTEVKQLLRILLVEASLPLSVIDVAASRELAAGDSITETRIKDVISQWNKDGKLDARPVRRPEIMEFYTRTDSVSATKELLEAVAVEAFLASVIADQALSLRLIDCGFRMITLAEDAPPRDAVEVLHSGFHLEREAEAEVQWAQLEKVVTRFEDTLSAQELKAKMFHRGFQLEKDARAEIKLAQVEKIARMVDTALGLNYVLNTYTYANRGGVSDTSWVSASICVSPWRFPRQ